MTDTEVHTNPQHSPHMVDVASAIAAVISTAIGAQTPEYSWLLYLSGAALIVLVSSMLSRTALAHAIWTRIQQVRDRVVLSRHARAHQNQVDQLRCAHELQKVLQTIEWKGRRPDGLQVLTNAEIHISSQKANLPRSSRVVISNLAYFQLLGIFDSALHTLSNELKSGDAYYTREDDMDRVNTLLRDYRDAMRSYNQKCEEINSRLRNTRLLKVYPHDCSLWREAAVRCKSKDE